MPYILEKKAYKYILNGLGRRMFNVDKRDKEFATYSSILLGISTQMHLCLTENCSGNNVISPPHNVLTQGSLLSTEGNICNSIYGGKMLLNRQDAPQTSVLWQE